MSAALSAACLLSLLALSPAPEAAPPEREITEYRGERLDPFDREYDNSIAGPQHVDRASYRLRVEGLVDRPLSLTYDEVLGMPRVERLITLRCVEGWKERLLFEGVRLAGLLERAGPRRGVTTVVFHAADGYSSSLPWEFVRTRDLLLAFRINGRTLDAARGFPFQVAAESKYGYKWVKWVERIELLDKPHKGYWESRGYSDAADVPRP